MKKKWTHKKFKSRIYKGSYIKVKSQRCFLLTSQLKDRKGNYSGAVSEFIFDTVSLAKKAGWMYEV